MLMHLSNMFTGWKLSFTDRLPVLYTGVTCAIFIQERNVEKFYCLINFWLKDLRY